MTLAYAAKLSLATQKTSVRAQKIDRIILKTYDMVSANFLFLNSQKKVWFFKKTFLLTNTSIEIVLEKFFLFFKNADF